MDYLTFLSLLVIILPPYVFIYIIIMYLGRRIDILLNFGLARSSHGKIAQYHGNVIKYHGSSLIECYLGTVCEYVGVPRPMLDNSFARMFIHADWFKK